MPCPHVQLHTHRVRRAFCSCTRCLALYRRLTENKIHMGGRGERERKGSEGREEEGRKEGEKERGQGKGKEGEGREGRFLLPSAILSPQNKLLS